MSLKDEMDKAVGTVEVIYQDFILEKKSLRDGHVFCFYEGKTDFSYYDIRISLLTHKNTKPFICEGKDNVLEVYKKIENGTRDGINKSLFFVDKDFDEPIEKEKLYTLPCYSIENLFITDESFKKIIQGIFSLYPSSKQEDDDFNKALEYYIKMKNEFIDSILLLNSWYSLQKKKSFSIEKHEKPKLERLKELNNLKFRFKLNSIQCCYDLELLKSLTQNYVEINQEEIDSEKNFLIENTDYNLRGKYFNEFLCKIINQLVTEANSPNMIFQKKHKTKFNICEDSLLSDLSQYAETPDCLKSFLNDAI